MFEDQDKREKENYRMIKQMRVTFQFFMLFCFAASLCLMPIFL